jgi:hypothetical protein
MSIAGLELNQWEVVGDRICDCSILMERCPWQELLVN